LNIKVVLEVDSAESMAIIFGISQIVCIRAGTKLPLDRT
jgi:hypothetical protein